MTGGRRIRLNVAVSYGRSVYSLLLGLLTARWLLLSLGDVDYGILGLVGGLVAFIEVFNNLLGDAVGRFYAVAVGSCDGHGRTEDGISECRRWFTAAIQVHTVVPLLLMAVGWPLGIHAIGHWLVIPAARLSSALWVWHFSCLAALTAMLNVPFRAMYTAKQEIAEVTVLNMLVPTFQAVLLVYMINHPGDWLARYAFWHCLAIILPRIVVFCRAVIVYRECRIERRFLGCWRDISMLARFAGWTAFGTLGQILQTQGLAILVNGLFGPAQNAAVTIANRLSARANTFASSIVGAFSPAIANTYGAGRHEDMLLLAERVCRLSALVVALVSVPLVLEMANVLRLWLKHPPHAAAYLCTCVVAVAFLDRLTSGLRIAVNAIGRIAWFQLLTGLCCLVALPVAVFLFHCGFGVDSVGLAMLLAGMLIAVVRVVAAWRLAGVRVGEWLVRVALPVVGTAVAGVVCAWLPRHCLDVGVGRVVAVSAAAEAVMFPIAWFAVMDEDERAWLRGRWLAVRRRFGRGRAD